MFKITFLCHVTILEDKVRSKLQKPLVSRDILHIRDFKQLNKQLKLPFEIYATKMERTLYFAYFSYSRED